MGTAMNSSDQTAQLLQPYNFELLQGLHDIRPFMKEYWTTSFHIALIYLLLIFVGHNYMKARKGFNLKGPLILWSFCLAIFSLFLLSKIIELGDTAFIVLRKRPLIFVHWYHHSTVLVFTSFAYKNKVAAGGWFMTMNFGVHAVMYTYYTLKAARVEPPRWFPRLITTLQILQMFMGAIVVILTYVWRQEQGCHTTAEHFFWSFILYLTYFILFAHFFHKTYIMPKVKANTKRE
ncbi:PREDICTED: elongation of very long chain fatty acids protein 3 isoform X2 [Hipposideros armiger]|uniref:Elongation of very long chain fatty acids protein n=1 Tax=Hipposideros armiger TaxID=186990 RepID=A0A8B7QSN9_HIPAR|nr:PREDICTED: elongation of very long chain fatty acids protein 3 isoform X2 [Hipposideros armiger]